jgi:iduronate 2-sulfatase
MNPQPLEGKSLLPVLRKPSLDNKEAIFHVYPRNRKEDGAILGRAVRTQRYRLVEWKAPGAAQDTADFELYDYKNDPGETRNLASTDPKLVKKLQALIAAQPEAKPQIPAKPDATQPKLNRAALFERKDANHDGKLTQEEFLANQPDPDKAPERFVRFDVNKDGVLSREEFIQIGTPKK